MTVADAAGASTAIVHATSLPIVAEQSPDGAIETPLTVKPAATTSEIATPFASEVPVLATVIENVLSELPAMTGSTANVLVTSRATSSVTVSVSESVAGVVSSSEAAPAVLAIVTAVALAGTS